MLYSFAVKYSVMTKANTFMKCAAAMLLLSAGVLSCKKDETTTPANNNNNNTANCQDGYVCLKLNGTDVSKPGSGYYFSDTSCFVKYEEGTTQLSIDIFGSTAKSYTVGDVRRIDKGRVYYFPDYNTTYMSYSGSLTVTEMTSDKKISGTFSAKMYKYNTDNSNFNFSDSMEITNGSFTKVQLT
jgi:hypothetical protein